MADIVIFYELPERELNNANLLKCELEKRGYTVDIKDYWNYHELLHPIKEKPKLVITQSGYDNDDLERFTIRFKPKIDKMLNMRYEQVISKRVLESTMHYPREYMKHASCLCWSEFIKEDMMKQGFSPKDLPVTGDIKTDFANEKFDSFFKTRKELADEFDLDETKEWILFISSFAFNESVEDKRLVKLTGDIKDGKYFQQWNIKSKKVIMEWIDKFVGNNPDKEFIYRPHPVEYNILNDDLGMFDLEEKYSNFHYISDYAIQEWIRPCDYLNTVISTSIIDVYLQNKKCNILRPVELNPDFDNPMLINSKHITNYEEFELNNSTETSNEFPVPQEDIEKYYSFTDKLAYEKICDFAEKMIADDSYKADFYPRNSKSARFKFILKKSLSMPKVIPTVLKSLFKNKSSASKTENKGSIYEENAKKINKIVGCSKR